MPKTEQICPVCELPVGNDPHEDCFEQARGTVEEATFTMKCPACGHPLSDDHNCE